MLLPKNRKQKGVVLPIQRCVGQPAFRRSNAPAMCYVYVFGGMKKYCSIR